MIDVQETAFDQFLRYGLFLGAIFQLVCIGAAIFGPETSDHQSKDDSEDESSEQGSPSVTSHRSGGHRRKMEKKKRR